MQNPLRILPVIACKQFSVSSENFGGCQLSCLVEPPFLLPVESRVVFGIIDVRAC